MTKYNRLKEKAKRNRTQPRSSKKPRPKRYVSYDSKQTRYFALSCPERTWEADERRRLRRRKHGWQ